MDLGVSLRTRIYVYKLVAYTKMFRFARASSILRTSGFTIQHS